MQSGRAVVMRSRRTTHAMGNTNMGVAHVTREPFAAVDSFVPINWKPNEIP